MLYITIQHTKKSHAKSQSRKEINVLFRRGQIKGDEGGIVIGKATAKHINVGFGKSGKFILTTINKRKGKKLLVFSSSRTWRLCENY